MPAGSAPDGLGPAELSVLGIQTLQTVEPLQHSIQLLLVNVN